MREPMTLDRLAGMTREQLDQVDVGQMAEAAKAAGVSLYDVYRQFWETSTAV